MTQARLVTLNSRGGFGAPTYASGNVVNAGGTGGLGHRGAGAKIRRSTADVLTLDGVSPQAANYATLTNSAAGDAVEFYRRSDTNVNYY